MWNDENLIDSTDANFEFHVEYKKNYWYPFDNGKLPKADPQGVFIIPSDIPRDYREFPKNTCLGWRGPMLKWELVATQPEVYWRDFF
jgi:hypothetical protein